MQHRERYVEHAKQHLRVLELLERERNEEASEELRQHLLHTLEALASIREILNSTPDDQRTVQSETTS
jgi:DNA-binding GntR family transcriptional regulator